MSSIGDDIRTIAESLEQSSIPIRMQSSSNQEDIPSSQSGGKSDHLRSWVWKHYSIIAGPKSERKALCIYCESKTCVSIVSPRLVVHIIWVLPL